MRRGTPHPTEGVARPHRPKTDDTIVSELKENVRKITGEGGAKRRRRQETQSRRGV